MKQIKIHIPCGLLLFAALFSAAPAQADAPVITCGEYFEKTNSGGASGTVEAVFDEVNNQWILTAVPADDTKWRFSHWQDANTDNPRTVTSFGSVPEASYTATFQRFIYTDCYSVGEFMEAANTVDDEHTYGHITTEKVGDVWRITAVPESSSYTFAQWSDGNAENPREIEVDGSSSITFYATFIPKSKVGKVDFWRKDGIVINTTPTKGGELDNGSIGGITVFYDGQLKSSRVPDNGSDFDIEPRVDYGVYYLPAAYGLTHDFAGKKAHIVYKNTDCEPIATLDTIIPFLIDGEETVSADGLGAGVHVLRGGVATFDSNQTIADLDIYAGGKAIIESSATVTTSSVTMRADAFTSFAEGINNYPILYPDLAVRGNLNNGVSNKINFDYTLDWQAYFPFALPTDVAISTEDVEYINGDNANNHYVLGAYSGAARASGGAGWYTYYDYFVAGEHQSIERGVGYNIYGEPDFWNGMEQEYYGGVFRFPMTVDLRSGDAAKSIGVTQYDAAKKENKNWNLISSPYLTEYNGPIYLSKDGEVLTKDDKPIKLRYITIPGNNFMSYHHKYVEDTVLFPFHSYLIQFDTIANELAFANPNPAARAAAPARRAAKAAEVDAYQELKAGVILSQEGQSDNTGLFIGTEYTNDYDINGDLSKMIGSKQGLSVYTMLGSKKLAYNAFPPANGTGMAETTIPLGYCNATAGKEMTFDVDWWHNKHLYADENITEINLIDDVEGVTTNLLEDSYTCTAQKASDNTRFSLGIRYTYKAPQIATDICGTPAETTMRDGIYDLLGRLISTDARASRPGVYIVIENGKARKEVIR